MANEFPINPQTTTLAFKWPEETLKSPSPIITDLSIDSKGFYLICFDKMKIEAECLDLALIHDTRTGPDVALPNGAECFQQYGGAYDVPLNSRWLSIYYGNTYLLSDLRIIHFCFKTQALAKEWKQRLFQYKQNQRIRHLSSLECLEKIHSKLIISLAYSKRIIPVQNLIQFLCRNNRDGNKEKRIRQILDEIKIPIKKSAIDANEFTFDRFVSFYMQLMNPHEIHRLFHSITGKHPRYINWENFRVFLQKQNSTFGMDDAERKANDLIKKYTENNEHFNPKGMSEEFFLRYLLSADNLIIDPKITDLYMNMNKPLSHYFISSSHNTYLSGSQLIGRASIEMYRQVLLTGCRCIELDVVDSENDEPEIKHIYTPVRSVKFLDVIAAIRDYAFKVTPYPLILSIENHCRAKAQAKMAKYLVDLLGDQLLRVPLTTHPCEENYPLPSPTDLLNKILVKNKKLPPKSSPLSDSNLQKVFPRPGTISNTSSSGHSSNDSSNTTNLLTAESRWYCEEYVQNVGKKLSQVHKAPRDGVILVDEYFSDDEPPKIAEFPVEVRQAKATDAMSDLVHYIVPTRFHSFTVSKERNRTFEMSSFPEEKAHKLIFEQGKDFLIYNQQQLCRIYPRGTRFESSNYNPYLFWPIGCHMVALNYQTLDVAMQLNLALFSFNGACGYIEKPSALCQPTSFDPLVSNYVDDVVSYQISLRILSGLFLCQDREPTFVDIQMYGTYGQINKRNEYRIRAKKWDGFHVIYDENNLDSEEFSIVFSRVILPEIAGLRFSVTAEDGAFVGQSFIPIAHLQAGYRYVPLKNLMNIPVNSSNLFLFIRKEVCVKSKELELTIKPFQPLIVQLHKSVLQDKPTEQDYSHLVVRRHRSNSVIPKSSSNPDMTIVNDPLDSYAKHFIVGSELNDQNRLCKLLTLRDIHPEELSKRDRMIQGKLRRLSQEFQSIIVKEENQFREHSDSPGPSQGRKASITSITSREQPNKDIGKHLLELYSRKFHQQEEIEYKYLDEYYEKLQKEIVDDYQRRLNEIDHILKKEKSDVDEYVRTQVKREKQSDVGPMTIRKLQEMSEKVKDILAMNLQVNLIQLEEAKAKEIESCFKRYADRYGKIEGHFHRGDFSPSTDFPR